MIRRGLIQNIILLACLSALFATLATAADYNRADWGGWQKGTRASVIGSNSVQWVRCYYTGAVVPPDAVQIDHVVPLKYAWEHGANKWPREKLQEFYNDTNNLVPVLAGVNAAKGDKGPSEWMPQEHQKDYIFIWILICGKYQLSCEELPK